MKKLLIDGDYECLFTQICVEESIIDYHQKLKGWDGPGTFYQEGFMKLYSNALLSKKNHLRQAIYQSILLYDEINIKQSSVFIYDYEKINELDGFNVVNHEKAGMLTKETFDVINEFESIIIKHISPTIKKYSQIKNLVISSKFKKSDAFARYILNRFFDFKLYPNLQKKHQSINKSFIDIRYLIDFFETEVLMLAARTLKTIEAYNDYKNILQNRISLSDLKNVSSSTQTFKDELEAYSSLRINLTRHINMMPQFENLNQVLNIKETKKEQIADLKHNIKLLIDGYKSGDKSKIISVDKLIKKILNNIRWTNKLTKLSKWTTDISLPILAMETLIGSPPLISTISGSTSAITSYTSSHLKKQYDWIFILR